MVRYFYMFIVVVMLGMGYKIYDLSSDVDDLKDTLEKQVLVTNKKVGDLALCEQRELSLIRDIEISNDKYDKVNISIKKAELELEEWKNKPPEVKYKTIVKEIMIKGKDYNKATCEDGLLLNKTISEINYEDL